MGRGKWYTKEEDAFLASSSMTLTELAQHLGRPYASVAYRLNVIRQCGIHVRTKNRSDWGSLK